MQVRAPRTCNNVMTKDPESQNKTIKGRVDLKTSCQMNSMNILGMGTFFLYILYDICIFLYETVRLMLHTLLIKCRTGKKC